jgi:hypothetical protein
MISALAEVILVVVVGLLVLDRFVQKREYMEVCAALRLQKDTAQRELEALKGMLQRKALTAQPKVAQDEQKKPLSGAQLRKLNQQQNVETWAGLQERPNSEVLKEN